MPTHDYDLANASGSSFRSDVNGVLDAIRERNSGTAPPSSVAANMSYVDTVDGIRYRRDNANAAWTPESNITATMTTEKTATYTVTLGDYGRLLEGNPAVADITFDLPSTANVLDGWHCWIRNGLLNEFAVVIDPSGAQVVDDVTTLRVLRQQAVLLWCTGSEWKTLRMPIAGMELIGDSAAAADATIDFASAFEVGFDYEVLISDLAPATDNVAFNINLSVATVFQASVDDYSFCTLACDHDDGTAAILTATNSGAVAGTDRLRVGLTGAQFGNVAGEGASLRVLICDPMAAGDETQVHWSGGGLSEDGEPLWVSGWGRLDAASQVDGVRFSFSAGNIAGGDFRLRRMVR